MTESTPLFPWPVRHRQDPRSQSMLDGVKRIVSRASANSPARSTVQANRFDNFAQVVGNRNRPIGERSATHAAAAQNLVELILVRRMVGHRGRGIFQLMPGEDTDHALVGTDDAFLAEQLGSGNTGGTGRLTSDATRSDLRLGVQNLLIRHTPHHPVADLECRRHLRKLTGRLISMALAIVEAFFCSASSCRAYSSATCMSGWP